MSLAPLPEGPLNDEQIALPAKNQRQTEDFYVTVMPGSLDDEGRFVLEWDRKGIKVTEKCPNGGRHDPDIDDKYGGHAKCEQMVIEKFDAALKAVEGTDEMAEVELPFSWAHGWSQNGTSYETPNILWRENQESIAYMVEWSATEKEKREEETREEAKEALHAHTQAKKKRARE